MLTAAPGHRLFPIGAGIDGTFVADLSSDGTRLLLLDVGGSTRHLGQLSEGPARGFVISPGGDAVAFLALTGEERRYRARLFARASGAVAPLFPEQQRIEDTGVVWTARGPIVTSRTSEGGLILGEALPESAAAGGFAAVVSAAPGGGVLAVRAFASGDTRVPGAETLQLVQADGRRVTVAATGGVSAIGWTRL